MIMYYIYNMKKHIRFGVLFLICMFRACLGVMAQTVDTSATIPVGSTAFTPSWRWQDFGGKQLMWQYNATKGKYYLTPTVQWVKANFASLGSNSFSGGQTIFGQNYLNFPAGGAPGTNGAATGFYPERLYDFFGMHAVIPGLSANISGNINSFYIDRADGINLFRVKNTGVINIPSPIASTNPSDSLLVFDAATKTIKQRASTGGSGGIQRATIDSLNLVSVQKRARGQENKNLNLNVNPGVYDMYIPESPSDWSNYPISAFGTLTVLRSQNNVTQLFSAGSVQYLRSWSVANPVQSPGAWILGTAQYTLKSRGDSLTTQVGLNTLSLTRKVDTAIYNAGFNTKVDKVAGYSLVPDADAVKLSGITTDFTIRYPDDFTSTTVYTNTQLANKQYRIFAVGNDVNGGSSYPTYEIMQAGSSPAVTINSSGGFTLAAGFSAQTGDRFRIAGVGASAAQVAQTADIYQTYTPPPPNLVTTIYAGQFWANTSPATLTTNASFNSINLIAGTSGSSLVISGLTGTPTGTLGRFTNASGNVVSSVSSANFTVIQTGVYRITFPVDATITAIRLSLSTGLASNINNVIVQAGSTYQPTALVVFKASTIPKIQYKTSELTNDVPFVKAAEIYNNVAPNIATFTNGFLWGPTSPSTMSANALFAASNIIPASANATFTIQGISSATFNQSQIGRALNASNGVAVSLTNANLTAITGGYRLTIPSDVTITAIVLNFNINDAPGTIVQNGSAIITSTLKQSLVAPYIPTLLSQFPDYGGLLGSSTLLDPAPPDLSLPKLPNSTWTGTPPTNVFSTTFNSFSKFSITPNTTYAIGGLTTLPSTAAIARYVDANGALVRSMTPSELKGIAGGYQFVTPTDTTIKSVAFFFSTVDVADITKLTVQLGSETQIATVKAALLKNAPQSQAAASRQYNRGLTPKPATSTAAVHIVYAGQSNMAGRAALSQLSTSVPYWTSAGSQLPGVIMNNDVANRNNTLNWHTFNFTDYDVRDGDTTHYWAFDIPLSKKILDYQRSKSGHTTDNIYATKLALGGTSISNTNGEGAGRWNADYEFIASNVDKLILQTENRIRAGYASSNGVIYQKTISCVFWNQGEGDRNDAANYYQNLKNVIYYFRGVAGNPRMPFVIFGIPSFSTQYNGSVENAKRQLASEDPYVFYINPPPDATYYNVDSLHLNGTGNEYVATQAYNLMTLNAANKALFGLLP